MKIVPVKKSPEKIKVKTRMRGPGENGVGLLAEWWKADNDKQLAMDLCGTAAYLKTNQLYRIRQLAVDIRLYCGLSVYSYAGSNVSKMDRTKSLPDDRPTFNVIQSAEDTLVSRITQNEPSPRFLTNGADYKKRHLAEELNQFVGGEFYRLKAYELGGKRFRDTCTLGTGAIKVYTGDDEKVALDRVMITDLFVDDNDALNGCPQQLLQLKLVDREKFLAMYSDDRAARRLIESAPEAVPDNSPDSARTTSDQIMVVEGWKLASGADPDQPGYYFGRHTLACVGGVIADDKQWKKTRFPFSFMNYADPYLGFWGQGIPTRLFGTQLSINRLMYTIHKSIQLCGVPTWLVPEMGKVPKAYFNNEIGKVIPYAGGPGGRPELAVFNSNAPDLYEERDRLIEYAFREVGVSNMQSTGQKPAGLNSGEAIRSYDDINSDRFAALSKKYENSYVDLAYLVVEEAMDIAKRTGKYSTVYPNKDGTKEISLPQMGFLKEAYVIKCFSESMLPKTPAGRIQTVIEQVQSGIITLKEGRRLMNAPDLEDAERLANASEERIFQILDKIVEKGEYTMPDPFLDLQLASTLTVQYINLYLAANLEEEKADLLRTFFNQVQTLIQASQPPPAPQPVPTANPMPAPVSPLVPNTPMQAA